MYPFSLTSPWLGRVGEPGSGECGTWVCVTLVKMESAQGQDSPSEPEDRGGYDSFSLYSTGQ